MLGCTGLSGFFVALIYGRELEKLDTTLLAMNEPKSQTGDEGNRMNKLGNIFSVKS